MKEFLFEVMERAARLIIEGGTTAELSKLRVRLAKLYEDVNATDQGGKRGTDKIFPPSPFTEHDCASRHE